MVLHERKTKQRVGVHSLMLRFVDMNLGCLEEARPEGLGWHERETGPVPPVGQRVHRTPQSRVQRTRRGFVAHFVARDKTGFVAFFTLAISSIA
jgi:hypothetical protein